MLDKSDQKKTQNHVSVSNLNVAEMDKATQRRLHLTERHGRKAHKEVQLREMHVAQTVHGTSYR
jgi:hypothetical protein